MTARRTGHICDRCGMDAWDATGWATIRIAGQRDHELCADCARTLLNWFKGAPSNQMTRSGRWVSEPDPVRLVTTWEAIDAPVLRWVLGEQRQEPYQWRFEFKPEPGVTPELPGIDDRAVHSRLLRLRDHGFVTGQDHTTMGLASAVWTRLRVTGQGLQALGEWPDLDGVSIAVGVQKTLEALADQQDAGEDATWLRRAVQSLARFAAGTVEQTIADVSGSAGGDAAT